MTNLKFSRNGVPMGRHKSKPENGNLQWTAEEDNYIRMAAAQNMSASTIGAKLGRTAASIYTRKWQLGIKNDTSVPRPRVARAPRQVKTRSIAPAFQPAYEIPQGMEIFTLENNVPLPERGNRVNDEARNQVRHILNQMRVGQSFVVPRKSLHVVQNIAKTEFEAYKIRTSQIAPDKRFFRIFRVA